MKEKDLRFIDDDCVKNFLELWMSSYRDRDRIFLEKLKGGDESLLGNQTELLNYIAYIEDEIANGVFNGVEIDLQRGITFVLEMFDYTLLKKSRKVNYILDRIDILGITALDGF